MDRGYIDDLNQKIRRREVIAVVGSGVSIGATTGNPVTSWTGLLEHAVTYLERYPPQEDTGKLSEGWRERILGHVKSGDLDELLLAAEFVSRKLGYPDNGRWIGWLENAFGALKVRDGKVIKALFDLEVVLLTTNYDDLIEQATGLRPVTWRGGTDIARVIQGEERAVLHLHGYFREPPSVVLGIQSYEQLLSDEYAQAIERLFPAKTLLFVGCGAGLLDPNFGALLEWMTKVFRRSSRFHYRLALAGESDALLNQTGLKLITLSYGTTHSDLGPFLRNLEVPSSIARIGEELSSDDNAEDREFDTRFTCRICPASQLAKLHEFCRGFHPTAFSPLVRWRERQKANRKTFYEIRKIEQKEHATHNELIGCFILLPINRAAERLLQSGSLKGFDIAKEHICPPSEPPAAVYLSGIVANGSRGRGEALRCLGKKLKPLANSGVRFLYTRSLTDLGLRLMKQYNFIPIDSTIAEERGRLSRKDLSSYFELPTRAKRRKARIANMHSHARRTDSSPI